jgi:hypothetical protein
MPVEIAENLCANPLKTIHTACTKAMKASNMQTGDEIEAQKRIDKLLESIIKVQGEIMNRGENTRIYALL